MPDYDSDVGLLNHLRIQKQSIEQFKAEVGASAADIAELIRDCDNMEAIMEFCELVDEYKTTAHGIKRVLIRGNDGDSVGEMMSAPTLTLTTPTSAGIEKRSRERDQLWKRQKTATEAAKLALDLIDTPSNAVPETAKPKIQTNSAQTGYTFSIIVSNRGDADMWDVLILRKGATAWELAKTANGRSVDVTITPTAAGQPEQFQARVQLKKKNQNYGQPSDIVYVTVNP